MLIILLVVATLSTLGFLAVAKVAHVASKRLGLDVWDALVWFGIAELPVDELAARRAAPVPQPRIGKTVAGGLEL